MKVAVIGCGTIANAAHTADIIHLLLRTIFIVISF